MTVSQLPATATIRPSIAGLMLGAAVYLAVAKFGMALFALRPANITILWLPIGIGMVLCLVHGRRAWPWILLATLVANFPGMDREPFARHLLHSLLSAAIDTGAAAGAAGALRRWLPEGLQRPRQLLRFVAGVCLLPVGISSVLLAANLAAGGYIATHAVPGFVAMLVFADTLGLLLIYPLFAAWQRRGQSRVLGVPGTLAALAALALVVLAFFVAPAAIFFVLPTLLFLVYHGHEHEVMASLLLCVCTVVSFAARDLGPFAIADAEAARLMLQAFLLTTTVVVIGAALQQHHLEFATNEIAAWHERALQDALTGLPNRRGLMERLAWHRRRQTGLPLCIAMIDIDHFKAINDSHGHGVGDEVLREVARRLQASLRDVDLAARYGGEEFTLVLAGLPLNDATAVVERIRAGFDATPLRIGELELAVRISAGMAQASVDADDQALLAEADSRLYAAKRKGRNRVQATD